MSIEREYLFDLEKVRLNNLRDIATVALMDFEKQPAMQWTTLRLEEVLLETLLMAVEKQVAKIAGCDICNDTSNSRYYHNSKYNYCPHCGQKLDWN